MESRLSLLFGVHAHQPVGNFPEVIQDAHLRCYRMFINTLLDYPEFKFSVHFSGWLLDVLEARWPEDMAKLATMTQRGQVEWFGSGDCEPVLAAIPHRDRVGQINTLSDKLQHHYGQRPRGAWLTERVWEASVTGALVESGIEFVAVDDYHFLCAGEEGQCLDGYFTTEDDGRTLDLFPISEAARYRFPFTPAHDVVAWLEGEAHAGKRAVIYFDDIEKFGVWPETYQWVYEAGWLRQFIEGVLRSPHVQTRHYGSFRTRYPTRGIVYLPTTSYSEMNEWTLSSGPAHIYRDLIEQEKQAGRFEQRKPFLRGGIWRNFMMRYPEANWMHKRMLETSQRLANLPAAQASADMRTCLYQAQANDAYWHGLFGGLYLPHLRRAIWNNLLSLETQLEAVSPQPAVANIDLDHDGVPELFLRNGLLQAVVREDGNAAIIELDAYALHHNFGDTLCRHREIYHDRLIAAQAQHDAHHAAGQGIASAHERISFRHEIQAQDLPPDTRPRSLFLESWQPEAATPAVQILDRYAPSAQACYVTSLTPAGAIEKSYRLVDNQLTVSYRVRDAGAGVLQIALNLAMPSCDGFLGRYRLADGSTPQGFGTPLTLLDCQTLSLEDGVLGGAVRLAASQSVRIEAQPHCTVSQSEAGFEKIMQAVTLLLFWRVAGSTMAEELDITLTLIPDISPTH